MKKTIKATSVDRIRDKLVKHGRALLKAPPQIVRFTGLPEADALLNNLATYPHAFVLGCLMDRQIKADKAWLIPFQMSERLGDFSMDLLSQVPMAKVKRLMSKPQPLHRFVDVMSCAFHSAVERISTDYGGDASRIWAGNPSSAEVVYRFLQFDGVGPKIATMAVNILARDFKIPFADYFSIDISADVHVRRVFSCLGLCQPQASTEQIIYKARAMYPQFPGIMDLATWEIGRKWCRPAKPDCGACYMRGLCQTAADKS